MIVGLDTSVVVRVLSGDPEDLALVAMRYLMERRQAGDRILVSDCVLAEAYYAFQYHYGVPQADTLGALRAFLDTPGVEATGEAAEILATPLLETANPGLVDRIIHRNYLRCGIDEMATSRRPRRSCRGCGYWRLEADRSYRRLGLLANGRPPRVSARATAQRGLHGSDSSRCGGDEDGGLEPSSSTEGHGAAAGWDSRGGHAV